MLTQNSLDLTNVFNVQCIDNALLLEINKNAPPIVIYDPGLYHIATCKSALSSVDKSDGLLYYRGVRVENLLDQDFLDVAFGIIFSSENPNREHFKDCIKKHFRLCDELRFFLDAISFDTHPMDVLSMATIALSGFEHKYLSNPNDLVEKAAYIIASVAITVAYRYTKKQNTEWVEPDFSRPYSEQILFQMHSGKNPEKIAKLGKILNTIMILHAEHGQNCSATTVRCIASARGNFYASVAGGMSAFNGLIHGGASQLVTEMYDEIIDNNLEVNDYVDKKIQNKELLMGVGQRTYNRIQNCIDPRVQKMFKILNDPEFDFPEIQNHKMIALKMIDRVLQDPFFQSKNLTPNPDLFNCIFFKLFGADKTMNTSMLALGRSAGWIANFLEHVTDKTPLTRPCDLPK